MPVRPSIKRIQGLRGTDGEASSRSRLLAIQSSMRRSLSRGLSGRQAGRSVPTRAMFWDKGPASVRKERVSGVR